MWDFWKIQIAGTFAVFAMSRDSCVVLTNFTESREEAEYFKIWIISSFEFQKFKNPNWTQESLNYKIEKWKTKEVLS